MRSTVLVPFYRGAVVFFKNDNLSHGNTRVLVPFYRGAVVFKKQYVKSMIKIQSVLVPFYRGAVVFELKANLEYIDRMFSSPFIEERLYL